MMISPEGFYEFELKGKSKEEILKEIRSLKRDINRNKKLIEDNNKASEPIAFMSPGPNVVIEMDREYLARAIKAYEDAGGKYIPTEQEKKSQSFNDALEDLHTFTFSIGGFPDGHEIRTYTITGDEVTRDIEYTPPRTEEKSPIHFPKDDLIEGLQNIHMGEWKRNYIDYGVLDGTQWQITLSFQSDRRTVKFHGSNDYPYNFDALKEFLDELEDDYNDDYEG